jgi:hypothetical protein
MRTPQLFLVGLAVAAALAVVARAAAGEHARRPGGEARERLGEQEGEEGEEEAERGPGAAASRAGPAVDPTYAKECGACHLAYPPSLLPAASWRKVMSGLDRHFGQNAELDEATRSRLERWLVDQAGTARGGEAPLRISEASWFRREHRGASARVGKGRPAASFADCAACHSGAARWAFDGDGATIGRE